MNPEEALHMKPIHGLDGKFVFVALIYNFLNCVYGMFYDGF